MFLVTGGAGFIGSNVVASLNESSHSDIAVNDYLGPNEKWRNLAKRQIAEVVTPGDLFQWLDRRKLDAVIHLGAISDTMAADANLILDTNFRLSLRLLDWCTVTRTPFIYASSAATYGNGDQGFSDDWSPGALRRLRPLNLYGWSKHVFDLLVAERFTRGEKLPPQWAGLKFFNVFGPNEYHKGEMMSLIAKRFDEAKSGQPVQLFKSHRAGIQDGDQKRDFIHVDDAVGVIRWLLDSQAVSGIFNVGTGHARSFRDLVVTMFRTLGRISNIEYIDMPPAIRDRYQYFTQCEVENLRRAGYNAGFISLEEGVAAYVTQFLNRADRYR
jgi:ADP-L-glycero-D-manno-heptose 6-epimerase